MTLAASGVLWLVSNTDGDDRSIKKEVSGSSTGIYHFNTAVGLTDPSIGSLPKSFSDFFGHQQAPSGGWGRVYASNSYGSTTWAAYDGVYTSITDSVTEQLITTAAGSPKNIFFRKTSGGIPYLSGDSAVMDVKRRTRQTTDAWSSIIQTYNPLTTQTYSADFFTYDYLIELS